MTSPREDGYIHLDDYLPAPWRIPRAALTFELGADSTDVDAVLELQPAEHAGGVLELDGEELELLAIAIDGQPLDAARYHYDGRRLRIDAVHAACTLHTRVRIAPAANTRLEGLYTSGELIITQCEAEGFRRITFFLDRPDVMSTWDITLRAEQARYPVLLANGNPRSTRALADGRHEAVWHNPHPTPCYLFAIAAGPLARVTQTLTTGEGRTVELNVWSAPADVERCHYALGAAERALRWDEQRYGRHYDLDVFNIVAVQDFTMGAMENKGLNIFNARYILADLASASDSDFLAIESVIAHEYLHNWSGNRVTCRDWFQLALKEGLTVFRDQEFSSDLHSRALKRIEAVRTLRARQFPEDSGALAHPVRPARYREISNFYTATVYEKGAEIVRLLHTLLGETVFRAGMDRYFADNDGRAATLEDFLAAHAHSSGRDLSQFARWYAQAGTPELRIEDRYDAASGDYSMVVRQQLPSFADLPAPAPLLIPLRLKLYGEDGAQLRARPTADAVVREDGVELCAFEHHLHWPALGQRPLPAFNQGFAAPLRISYAYTPTQLGQLARWESDPVSRWDLLQTLARAGLLGELDGELCAQSLSAAWGELLGDAAADPAFVAECLHLPDFDTLAEQAAVLDIDALLAARKQLRRRLVDAHAPALLHRYQSLAAAAEGGLDATAMAARALRNACLGLLSRLDPACALADAQYHDARSHTDRLAALRCLVHRQAPGANAALDDFRSRCHDDPLLTDQWLALVATRPQPDCVDGVRRLLDSHWWKPANPNRVRAVLGQFARNNPPGFHRADGAGYRLLLEQVIALDPINPQVAARLLGALERWRRFDPARRAWVEAALRPMAAQLQSADCRDLLARLLA